MLMLPDLAGQPKLGFENYNYWGLSGAGELVPMIHFETKNNWYAELRYNYEELRTMSFFAGKSITGGDGLQFSLTPLAGFSAGRFTGVSLAANAQVDWKKLYLSSQTQYSMATKKNIKNFFFSWTELGYNISQHFFSGLAAQFTRTKGQNDLQPGILTGLSFKDLSVPFYVFSPFQSGRYYIVGLNFEYRLKKRN